MTETERFLAERIEYVRKQLAICVADAQESCERIRAFLADEQGARGVVPPPTGRANDLAGAGARAKELCGTLRELVDAQAMLRYDLERK